jgi:hypothetical protein
MAMSGYLPSGPGVSTNSRPFAVSPFTCSELHFAKHASRDNTTSALQLSFISLILLFYQLSQVLSQYLTGRPAKSAYFLDSGDSRFRDSVNQDNTPS